MEEEEMRDKKAKFKLVGNVKAATGVKISALDIDEVISGMPLRSCDTKNIEKVKKEVLDTEKIKVTPDTMYLGFDAYKKMMETDVDIIIEATPPHFRPAHFAAAVEARKHVFLEKPLGVDPAGYKSILES